MRYRFMNDHRQEFHSATMDTSNDLIPSIAKSNFNQNAIQRKCRFYVTFVGHMIRILRPTVAMLLCLETDSIPIYIHTIFSKTFFVILWSIGQNCDIVFFPWLSEPISPFYCYSYAKSLGRDTLPDRFPRI